MQENNKNSTNGINNENTFVGGSSPSHFDFSETIPRSSSPTKPPSNIKFIVITGGSMSGVGKGVTICALGSLLKAAGFRLTAIKIDPYLNIDAGTMSPYEHGEVFVLNDGGEADLDLGNYERAFDCSLSNYHNITTGKVYGYVLSEERKGSYLGKTVQLVPHITDAIQKFISQVSQISIDDKQTSPDICLVEIGGTVGDIESAIFLEAMQRFQSNVGMSNMMLCHLAHIPVIGQMQEQKTKPTQHSTKELFRAGLRADILLCRCTQPLDASTKKKVSMFCQVPLENVISVHDINNLNSLPLVMAEQNLVPLMCRRLGLSMTTFSLERGLERFHFLCNRRNMCKGIVKIGLVGKYTGLPDTYHTVIRALEDAALESLVNVEIKWIESSLLESVADDINISKMKQFLMNDNVNMNHDVVKTSQENNSVEKSSQKNNYVENISTKSNNESCESKFSRPQTFQDAWNLLEECDAVLCPGGFGDRGISGKGLSAAYCRLTKKPYLGICLGMQTAAIEFARNELGLKDANSEEFDAHTPFPVVISMPEHIEGLMGGTMRLGLRTTCFTDQTSLSFKLYDQKPIIQERHRHRYEINPLYVPLFEKHGFKFVAKDINEQRMEIAELANHPFFICVQFHPEFLSKPLSPSPIFLGFILACTNQLTQRLKNNNDHLRAGIIYKQYHNF